MERANELLQMQKGENRILFSVLLQGGSANPRWGNLGNVGLNGKRTRIKYRKKISCEWKGEAEIEGIN